MAIGNLFLRRREFEIEQASLKTQLSNAESRLRELASGPLPLLMVDDLLAEVETQSRKETQILAEGENSAVIHGGF